SPAASNGAPHRLGARAARSSRSRRSHSRASAKPGTRKPWEYCSLVRHTRARSTRGVQKAHPRAAATTAKGSRGVRLRRRGLAEGTGWGGGGGRGVGPWLPSQGGPGGGGGGRARVLRPPRGVRGEPPSARR